MAKATVESADDVPKELRDTRDELSEELVEYRDLQDDLAEYEGLDDEIDRIKYVIDETEDAHRTYVKNEDEAAKLPGRRKEVEDKREKLDELESERNDIENRVESVQDEFDAERLNEVQEELDELNPQHAKTEQKLDNAQGDLEDAREELNELEDKQERKQNLEDEVTELERDQEFARWARNSLQQGAEDLRDLLTSEIGDRANAIFQQLRGNPTETLVWDKTYNLRVRVRGQNKPFQTLSGGEKMAAALSVRLAILEQLASLGVAFLDEPTTNLDQQKKQNLVNQLDDLDQLNQLMVVSHDRTFESMTERTIELEKDEDREVTRVVSE
jgi:exonuclease SbcC